MTPDEIKKKREEIRVTIETRRMEIEIEESRLRLLWRICKHPNKFKRSTMGDLGEHCPDCGWGT